MRGEKMILRVMIAGALAWGTWDFCCLEAQGNAPQSPPSCPEHGGSGSSHETPCCPRQLAWAKDEFTAAAPRADQAPPVAGPSVIAFAGPDPISAQFVAINKLLPRPPSLRRCPNRSPPPSVAGGLKIEGNEA